MARMLTVLEKHRRLVMLFAGGLSATGFAPLNLWPVTLLCLALLMHVLAKAESGKQAFWLGWAFGVGHFTVGNNWIALAFTFQANMPAWLGWCAVPVIAVYLAVYPGLASWGAWRLANAPRSNREVRRLTLSFILAFAGCWIITEWLRSWVFTGFAWNPLGVVLLPINFAGGARYFGSYALGGIAIAIIGLGMLALQKQTRAQALLMMPFFLLTTCHYIPSNPAQTLSIPLTIVQPNISQTDKHRLDYDEMNFRRLAENSIPKTAEPRLVLWPESAIPWRLEEGYPFRFYQFQPGENPLTSRAVLAQLLNPGDLLLTGNDRLEFDQNRQIVGARNSMIAMDERGKLIATYDKAHLVPYGEYLALRWLLEPLGAARLVPGDLDFWPGAGARTLALPFDGRRIKVGLQICYEIIFSGQVVDRAHRPHFIFNPSNDAWFGSWGQPQFLTQARLRAIEEGLPVVRSTPTGISAIIDADGRVVKSLPVGIAGRIDAQLPMAKAPTLFARFGNVLPLGFAALLIALSLLPLARRRTLR